LHRRRTLAYAGLRRAENCEIIGGAISLGISGCISKSTPKVELTLVLRNIFECAVRLPTRFRDTAGRAEEKPDKKVLMPRSGQFDLPVASRANRMNARD
jgi:hypothetical protein